MLQLVEFSPLPSREATFFRLPACFTARQVPIGSKFFPNRIHVSEGDTILTELSPLKMYQFSLFQFYILVQLTLAVSTSLISK